MPPNITNAAVVVVYSRIAPVNRTHEECDGCALVKAWPPKCDGHESGPVACEQFVVAKKESH